MRLVFLAIRSFLILLSITTVAQATDYYVSPTGNDSNSGTSSTQPWRTITKVNNKGFSPGDRILFQGGKTFSGTLNFDSSDNGSLANPITVGSYGTGRAVISAGSGRGFSGYNVAGYRIQNINFVGSGRTTNTADGIQFVTDLPGNVKLEYVDISNVEVSGFKNHGVSIGGYNSKSGFRYVQISHVDSHDNGFTGINVWGYFSNTLSGYSHENVYVGYCKAYNNPGIGGLPYNSGSGIVISDVNGGTIEDSVAYNNGALNTANGGPVGIWTWDSNNVIIQHNESHHNHTASASDGGGFDLDGGVTNSVIQYNYSHDNDGAGYLLAQYSGARPFSNNTVRYNISQNDGRKNSYAGIQLWNGGSGVKNSEIHNNTIYITPAATGSPRAVYFMSPTTNIHLRNNIFITTGALKLLDLAPTQTGLLFQGNDYWSSGSAFQIRWRATTYSSLSAWRSGSSQEKVAGLNTGFSTDPQLNNPGGGGTLGDASLLHSLTAYKLKTGSPMIDQGLDLLSQFGMNPGAHDFYGNPISFGQLDVGVYDTINAIDIVPPSVSVTFPLNGTTVNGPAVTVTASASDNVGVAGVQFKLDGANLGSESTSSPYSMGWDTTLTADGSHTLSATVRDTAGNIGNSILLNVMVANAGAPVTVSFLPTSSDGRIAYFGAANSGCAQTQWNLAHSATTAPASTTEAVRTNFVNSGCQSASGVSLTRGFLSFDTSSIPDGAVVTSAKLKLFVTGKYNHRNDGNDFVTVVQGRQASPTALANSDYPNAGDAITNPTEGSNRVDITNILISAYSSWILNATGISWVSKTGYTAIALREGHDLLNIWPAYASGQLNAVHVSMSEQSGTNQDPILEITYIIP